MTPSYSWKTSSRSIAADVCGGSFSVTLIERRPGIIIFAVDGPAASDAFSNESGGHRWQRIPPTERNGRVQTSTITVAVLPELQPTVAELNGGDLQWTFTRGSGAGGQNRNKVETVAVVKHLPTGMVVRCETERSQYRNRQLAFSLLRARLNDQAATATSAQRAADRRAQVGSGMRGDKRRTIRVRDASVKDHITGASWRYADYLAGNW